MHNISSELVLLSMMTFYFVVKLYLAYAILAIHTLKVENELEKNGEQVLKVEHGTKRIINVQKLKQEIIKNILND